MLPPVALTGPVTAPGLYAMTEAEYHADPCPLPSLSRSIGKILIDQSPRHAWTAHPRLNPKWKPSDNTDRAADVGSAAHALLLGQGAPVVAIDAETYQTKAAKAERDAARADGAIPLINPDRKLVDGIIARAKEELAGNDNPMIRGIVNPEFHNVQGINEVTACWQDRVGGHWCRARMDRLSFTDRRLTIVDYKTTQMSAAPADVKRAIFNNAYQLQDGFYRRGIRHLFPEIDRHELELDFLFIVQEQESPHEITVARIDAPGRIIGEKMASAAVRLWDQAVSENKWPGYPSAVVEAEMPAYVETNWCAREIEDQRIAGLPFDPFPSFEARPYQPKPVTWGAG